MGFLGRLLGEEMPQGGIPEGMDVVGESYYQDALASIAGPKTERSYNLPIAVELRREPNNPHDKHAVMCLIDNKLVGYIDRDHAPQLQAMLRACEKNGTKAVVDGYIKGGHTGKSGTEHHSYRVKLKR